MRYRYNATSILQNSHNRGHMGCHLWVRSLMYVISVIAVQYVITWYRGTHYNPVMSRLPRPIYENNTMSWFLPGHQSWWTPRFWSTYGSSFIIDWLCLHACCCWCICSLTGHQVNNNTCCDQWQRTAFLTILSHNRGKMQRVLDLGSRGGPKNVGSFVCLAVSIC